MPARHSAGIAPPLSATIAVSAIGLPLLDAGVRDLFARAHRRIVERSTIVSSEDRFSTTALTGAQSRRAALHTGSALLAGMSVLAYQRSVAAQATPVGDAPGSTLLVQSFSQGTLFPTQGDVIGVPYTVYLWDAADRGFFF